MSITETEYPNPSPTPETLLKLAFWRGNILEPWGFNIQIEVM